MTADRGRDPYATLGVSRTVPDAELRSVYRRLVRLHHPDHNGGSRESTLRFEEIQDAYSRIQAERRARGAGRTPPRPAAQSRRPRRPPPPPPSSPDLEARIAGMERELREAQETLRAAREAARQASAASRPDRPTDEELGYIRTDDSFTKILADARDELTDRLAGARQHPVVKRLEDLIDELEDRI